MFLWSHMVNHHFFFDQRFFIREASHKVWRCGGRIEIHPCSRVGHWFREEKDHRDWEPTMTPWVTVVHRASPRWWITLRYHNDGSNDEYRLFYSQKFDLQYVRTYKNSSGLMIELGKMYKCWVRWWIIKALSYWNISGVLALIRQHLWGIASSLPVDVLHPH